MRNMVKVLFLEDNKIKDSNLIIGNKTFLEKDVY